MSYAIFVAGQPVELPAGQSFRTFQMVLSQDEAVSYLGAHQAGDIIDQVVEHAPNALEHYSSEDRARFCILDVVETSAPTDPKKRVLGPSLINVDGVLTRAWVTENKTLAELKAEKLVAAEAEYQGRRQSPMPWDFGAIETLDDDGVSQGPAGMQTLQMRSTEANQDIINWLAVYSAGTAMMAADAPDALNPIKATSNLWVQTTAAQSVQVLMSGDGAQTPAFNRGLAMLQAHGRLKAAINGAVNASAVVAIDVASPPGGWPA